MPKINLTEGKYSVRHNGRITKKGFEIHGPDGRYLLRPFLEEGKIPSKDINKKAMLLLHESNDGEFQIFGGNPKDITEDKTNQRDLLKIVRNISLTLKKDVFVHHKMKKTYGLIDGIVFKDVRIPMTHEEIEKLTLQGQTLNLAPRAFGYDLKILGARDSNILGIMSGFEEKSAKIIRVPDYIDVNINLDDFYRSDFSKAGQQFIDLKAFDRDNNESSDFSKISIENNNPDCSGISVVVSFMDKKNINSLRNLKSIKTLNNDNTVLRLDQFCLFVPEVEEVVDSIKDKHRPEIVLANRRDEMETIYKYRNKHINSYLDLDEKSSEDDIRKHHEVIDNLERIKRIAEQTPDDYFEGGNQKVLEVIKDIKDHVKLTNGVYNTIESNKEITTR